MAFRNFLNQSADGYSFSRCALERIEAGAVPWDEATFVIGFLDFGWVAFFRLLRLII